MKITRSKIATLLRYMARDFGHGFKYEYCLNGNYTSKTELCSNATLGDNICVEVYRRSSWGNDWIYDLNMTLTESAVSDAINHYNQSKKSSSSTRDSQRARVYRWENFVLKSWTNENGIIIPELTKKDIMLLLTDLSNTYNTDIPKVQISNQRSRTSCFKIWERVIVLASGWGQRTDVVLHEFAHYLITYFGWNVAHHGPQFVAVLIDLYEMILGVPRELLLHHASNMNVKYTENFNLDSNG